MKGLLLCLTLVFLNQPISAQDTSVVKPDTVKKNLFEVFHWTEKSKSNFEIIVPGYDTLKKGNNDFQLFFYIANDKPDGKLTVRDEKGNKVRECVYRNQLMFEEHWWFSSGEKEFDGVWSESVNEYGDQILQEYKWYYKNRKLRKHGFHNGITTTYYDNGEKESEKTFMNGKAHGLYRAYYPNGKIQTEGQFF